MKTLLPLWLCILAALPALSPTAPMPRARQDYALLFAVNDYRSDKLTDLSNPIKNAGDIAEELETRYGFEAEVVPNPTYDDIDKKIKEYENHFARNTGGRYPENGQLLIFFSGHGAERYNVGYFLPADADPDNLTRSGLDYNYWRNRIDAINCRHILVAIDACHSATFDPDWANRPDRHFSRPGELSEKEKVILNHSKYKSRFFFTSDGKGDQTPDRSSFANKILEGLRTHSSPQGFLTSSELFASYIEKAFPTPGGGDFGASEGGASFLFFHEAQGPAVDVKTSEQRRRDLEKNAIDSAGTTSQSSTTAANPNFAAQDDFVKIEGGTFQMGDIMGDKELENETLHQVTVTTFYLSPYEVTFEEYDHYCEATRKKKPSDSNWGRGKRPVVNVSWYDAVEYCNWRSSQRGLKPVYIIKKRQKDSNNINRDDGLKWTVKVDWSANGYRLPTEAEWEYAARALNGKGGGKVRFGNGKDVADPKEINFNGGGNAKKPYSTVGNDRGRTTTVGNFRANSLGLYDMSGNVWEWCWDWYEEYPGIEQTNPKGADSGAWRVFRGGSWIHSPRDVKAAYRGFVDPSGRYIYGGFRLARM
ncbi:MAG: SUMF1/EgtB/PvdO family nonheme iron enzyme [Saprospiraceae bacterium]|nr:SUMF1/EgtB/PvdO family nonheme iron enzyme [Saprospiraceae bacterium]